MENTSGKSATKFVRWHDAIISSLSHSPPLPYYLQTQRPHTPWLTVLSVPAGIILNHREIITYTYHHCHIRHWPNKEHTIFD